MPLRNFLLAVFFASLVASLFPMYAFATDALKLQISSPAFADGATIPKQFSCSGANQSPPLSWSGVPQRAKSLALILDDPDAPRGTFVHWVMYNIAPDSSGIAAGGTTGELGANSMGEAAYMGPCPPPGNPHHYHFRLFALDTKLNLEGDPKASALRDAMNGHVIDNAELVGIFGR